MKCKAIFLVLVSQLLIGSLYAGGFDPGVSRHKDASAKTSLADPGEEDYDMKHITFHLHATDTSIALQGDVTTAAVVTAASMNKYVFELDTLMQVDSAKVNGAVLAVSTTGFVRTINLPVSLVAGDYFRAQIFYHGVAPSGGGFFNGVTHAVSGYGTQMVYTVSDPWVALDWWPCKQDVDDKIDTVDMFVTVPRGVVDGSNGVLVNTDTTSVPGYWTYHWQTHYPITYYLVSIAIARYAEYHSFWHFSGSSDSMLVQNFFMDTAAFNPLYKANFDSIGMFIDYFSSLFGRYPFWQEKYGVCYTNLPGGMEHQTMTTIGVPETYVIAHELCHQWFGDHVSYARWGDVWLSEGFATFAEQLFYTRFWGASAGAVHRKALLNSVFSSPCGEVFVNDTTGPTTLFDQPTVYNKGQGIVSMLRFMAPADSQFFQVLRNYQDSFAFGNATTADLQAKFEHLYGFSLDTFFRQWIYGKGFPIYHMSWNQSGSSVYVQLAQRRSCTAYDTTFFTPLELQLHSATGDTVLRLYNNADTQLYTINWSQTVDTVYLNPDYVTICRLIGPVVHDYTLGAGHIIPESLKIFPNPSGNSWELTHLPGNLKLVLMDATGKVVWRGISTGAAVMVPGGGLPSGDYFLRVGDQVSDTIKLVHW